MRRWTRFWWSVHAFFAAAPEPEVAPQPGAAPPLLANFSEVASFAHTAPPRTAFVLVGAANDIEWHIAAFRRNVVDGFGVGDAGETFVLLKAIHPNKQVYTDTQKKVLRDTIRKVLRPTKMLVKQVDPTIARFQNHSEAAIDCLWPVESGNYADAPSRAQSTARFMYWWGAMQFAIEMIMRRERELGHAFEVVVFSRADVVLDSPMAHFSQIDARLWYSASEPPDAFWIASRDVAAAVMQTAESVVRCVSGDLGSGGAPPPGGNEDCCAQYDRFSSFFFSWWLPCYWTSQLWDSGLRLAIYGAVNGTWLKTISRSKAHHLHTEKDAAHRLPLSGCPRGTDCERVQWPVAYDHNRHARPKPGDRVCGPWTQQHKFEQPPRL